MKNNGFTLVELLGVIIILALLITLVFPSIINSVKSSGEKTDKLTLEMIYNASDLYISNHKDNFKKVNGNKYIISLEELVAEDLLASPIKLSDSDIDITDSKSVQVTYSNGEFTYELKNSSECVRINRMIIYRNSEERISIGDSIENLTNYETEETKSNITQDVYLKHEVEDNIVKASYACLKYSESGEQKEVCLKGIDTNAYGTFEEDTGYGENGDYAKIKNPTPGSNIEEMFKTRSYFESIGITCYFTNSQSNCTNGDYGIAAFGNGGVNSINAPIGCLVNRSGPSWCMEIS